MKLILTLSLCLFVLSCAEAGKEGVDARPSGPDASTRIDGGSGFPDAGSFPDARTFPDARVFPDAAAPGGDAGLTCETTADCGPAECCFTLGGPGFCIPGAEPFPGLCLPN